MIIYGYAIKKTKTCRMIQGPHFRKATSIILIAI